MKLTLTNEENMQFSKCSVALGLNGLKSVAREMYIFISPVYQHDYENCRRIQEVFFESDGKEGKEKEEDSRQTAKW